MSYIKRLMVVVLLLGIALTVGANAQQAPEEEKPALKLNGGNLEDIPVAEMVQLYAEYSKQAVMFDPKLLSGTVDVLAPREGFEPDVEETLLTALAKYRLTLVKSGDYCEIVPMAEACTMCDSVSIADLDKLPGHRFARIVVHLQHTDANAARGALQNLCTRQGGIINPVISPPGGRVNALIICDMAENLRRMLKTIAEIDAAPGNSSRVIALKHTGVGDILDAVLSSADRDVRVGYVAASGQFVLTGHNADIDRVEGVITALDVKSGE